MALRKKALEEIRAAEARVDDANAELRKAKAARDFVRAKYSDRVAIGDPVVVAGLQLVRKTKSTGRRFSLKDYLAGGRKVTAAMAPYVSESSYEVWSVEEIEPAS